MPSRNALALAVLFTIFTTLVTLPPAAVGTQNLHSIRFVSLVFAENITAETRQAELIKYVNYLQSIGYDSKKETIEQDLGTDSMLQAFFVGEYFRMQGALEDATYWYLQSARGEATPLYQDGLDYAVRSRLSPDGSMLLHNFATMEGWKLDKVNSNVRNVDVSTTQGHTTILFQNQPQQRDALAYELYFQRLPIGYHSTLSLLANVHPGTFLTLEIRADGKLTRYLNYQEGVGEWMSYDFVIEGSALEMVKLSFSEPSETATASDLYSVELDELKLHLTEDVGSLSK